jgi:hypothetical protein
MAACQGTTQPHERLAQVLTCLLFARVAPEKAHEALPRVGAAGSQGEVCQEGLRLARRQWAGACPPAQQEPTEEVEVDSRHGRG